MTSRGPSVVDLPGGPSLRMRGGTGSGPTVLIFGGTTRRDGPGVWSPTGEWLARRLAARHRDLRVAEVRYRHGSWRRLPAAIEDGLAAVRALEGDGAGSIVALGFSLGGAVAVGSARRPSVTGVIGLAPWLPPSLELRHLAGRPLRLLHGTLDGGGHGLPGVPIEASESAVERARAVGVDAQLTLVGGGVHGLALRAPWGGVVRLPRAGRWARLVDDRLVAMVDASRMPEAEAARDGATA